jgi:hypothetical protein
VSRRYDVTRGPLWRQPLITDAGQPALPPVSPTPTAAEPFETGFADWRNRLTRNLARRSDSKWEPLTRVHATEA